MRWQLRVLAVGLVLATTANSRAEIIIQFDYSTDSEGFFAAGSAARATLEAGGAFFEGILRDDLLAIAPGGGNSWTAGYVHPATGANSMSPNLVIPADTVTIFVGSRDLPGTELGIGARGSVGIGGTQDWINTVVARGEGDGTMSSVAGPTAYENALWGGALAIDNNSTWHLDHTAEPTGSEADLYSVILHELGQMLGLGYSSSWNNLATAGEFTGASSVDEYGGYVPLSPDEHYWMEGTMSNAFYNGASQEAAMDPTLAPGTRKLFTDLDVAALDDIGWDAGVPEPSSIVMIFSAAVVFGLGAARRRWRQKS